jgi:hypothetical protein
MRLTLADSGGFGSAQQSRPKRDAMSRRRLFFPMLLLTTLDKPAAYEPMGVKKNVQ